MKKLRQNDLFKHIDQFLKDKGIEVRESAPLGSTLRSGCQILTDTINHAQSTFEKARDQMDGQLDKMRNIIHEKTAPRKKSAKATQSKAKAKRPKKKAAKKTTRAKAAKKPAKTQKKSSPKQSRSKGTPQAKKKVTRTKKSPTKKSAAKKTRAKSSSRKKR